LRDKKIKLTCINSIGNINNLKFKEGEKYEVAINHPNLVSVIDNFGYKMNFSRKMHDLNLPYIWYFFSEEDREILDANTEKLY